MNGKCSRGGPGRLDTLVLVWDRPETSGQDELHPGDCLPVVRGAQGADMVRVGLHLTGDVPACVDIEAVARREDGGELSSTRYPIYAYRNAQIFQTDLIWLPGEYAGVSAIEVTTRALGREATLPLRTNCEPDPIDLAGAD